MNKDFVSGIFVGCLTAAAAAMLAIVPPQKSAPAAIAEIYDCGNYAQMPESTDETRYAKTRLKAGCEAAQETAVLVKVWENDPQAGEVSE